MPFAPVSNPDLAGEFMFRGITHAGDALGAGLREGLDAMIEKHQLRAKERKAYLGMADAMAQEGILSPVEVAALQNKDTDAIKGYVDGKKVASILAQQKQQALEQKARTDLFTQQAEAARQETANAAVQPEFFAAMERYVTPGGGYRQAAQTPEGRAAMIAGTVSPQALSPMEAMSSAASETGYKIRPSQLDDILRAANAARTVQVPEGFTPSKMVVGGVTYEAPPAPLSVPPGFNATQIVVGDDGKPRYTLEPTPQTPVIPSNMQPKTVTVDAKGHPTVTYSEPDAAKKLAADYPWLLDDDIETFKTGLKAVKDPAERNAVIETRNRYETALGRPNLLERFLMGETKAEGGAGKPSAPQSPKAAAEKTAEGVTNVTSKPQRDALPKGTRYRTPDGKVWIKQ